MGLKSSLKITLTALKKIEPKEKPFRVWDTELKNFYIRVQPTGRMTYYLHYRTSEGKPKQYVIGSTDSLMPEQARDIAKRKAGEVANGVDIQEERAAMKNKAENTRKQLLGVFIAEQYEPWATTNTKTGARTVQSIRREFAPLLNNPMGSITEWNIEQWRTRQKKAGKAKSSINRELASLRGCLSRAVEWGVIESSPLHKTKMEKVNNQRTRYLTNEESHSLIKALDEREQQIREGRDSGNQWLQARGKQLRPALTGAFADHLKPMVIISLNTGLRRGELLGLQWKDINLQKRTLLVSESKSGKSRYVSLNNTAHEAMKGWKASSGNRSGHVFPNPRNNDKPLTTINTAWGNVLKAAQITGFNWHDLRHTFASRLAMAGTDLNTIRELMGHADIKMTLRYAHLAPEHKAAAVAALDSFHGDPSTESGEIKNAM